VHQATGKFSRFNVVPANERHEGHVFRLPVIDMSVPRRIVEYDKFGYKNFLTSLKFYVFGSETARFTKKRCDKFFSNPNNFELRSITTYSTETRVASPHSSEVSLPSQMTADE